MDSKVNCESNEAKNNFWKEPGISSIPKLPGKVMKQNSHGSENHNCDQPLNPSSRFNHHSSLIKSTHSSHQHRRNNSTSFESFTASCADAWDSQIDDSLCQDAINRRSSSSVIISKEERIPPIVSESGSKLTMHRPNNGSSNINRHKAPLSIFHSGERSKSLSKLDNHPKITNFKKLLFEDSAADLNQLRSMAWAGIPNSVRPITWKLLLGYLPVIAVKRASALKRKRAEYEHLVNQYYNNRGPNDEMWRQIHIDIPRMQPLISIFQQETVQKIFERILYIYSIRHPASGYVQGMNDLVIPFFVVYLSEFIPNDSLSDLENFEVSSLAPEIIHGVEADSFWSLNKLLDSIQDNYTFAQPGIQCLVNLLSRVMSRVDSNLHDHLTKHNVHYLLFSFRWMNNLLIRELPLRCIIRLWDTYLAEGVLISTNSVTNSLSSPSLDSKLSSSGSSLGNGSPFAASFHLYVCAAFLRFWSKNLLQEKDFQGLILYLQNLPTFHWTDNEIEMLVADAYSMKETFTPNHLLS